jgi:CRP/FNR family cyclic AMP-dependent transcriptional regulator
MGGFMIESKYLKENIENIQRLMSISALKHFETRNLGKLLRLSKIRQYEDGEAIIQEGDMDPWLYFLLSGKIRITKEGEEISAISKKGEIFGEMRIIDDQTRSATVLPMERPSAWPWIPRPATGFPLPIKRTSAWTFCCCSTGFLPNT